ncbi:hypothetical protein [Dietzia maris]|uniref:Uncharacterized protein n=1 Tax=Dietzia maris TaxID=37915 RepID=A0ABT8H033_9ACTN|nr:hypothetical protein [Dietzia maris]MDN4505821.1 hypothetical protein [Dietzia maris]
MAVTHHWSGVIIAIPLLLTARRRTVRIAVAVLVLTHLIGTHYAYALTAVDPAAHVLQWLIGNAQGVSGIAAFAMLLGDAALGGGAPGRRQPIRSGAWNSASNLS